MTASAPFIIAVRCHYCSKQRAPHDILALPGRVKMCRSCYDWHQKAILMLARAEPPPGCQFCGRSFDELERESPDGNTRLMLHLKDGIYQIACRACSDAYIPKRRDLFRDTVFGHMAKL